MPRSCSSIPMHMYCAQVALLRSSSITARIAITGNTKPSLICKSLTVKTFLSWHLDSYWNIASCTISYWSLGLQLPMNNLVNLPAVAKGFLLCRVGVSYNIISMTSNILHWRTTHRFVQKPNWMRWSAFHLFCRKLGNAMTRKQLHMCPWVDTFNPFV